MFFFQPTKELGVLGYDSQNSITLSYDKFRFITFSFLRGFLKNLYAVYVSSIYALYAITQRSQTGYQQRKLQDIDASIPLIFLLLGGTVMSNE
jgi:hypothetical protein